jgi:hypothetical protein
MEPVSLRGYARHRGVSLKAVQKAIKSGRIQTTPEGKVDVDSADANWQGNTAPRPTAPSRPSVVQPVAQVLVDVSKPDLSTTSGLEYSRARAVTETYRAKLAKMEFDERSEKLISRDEVQVEAFNRFRAFREGMVNIPNRLAAVLAAESDPRKVHEMLTVEIRQALVEFADGNDRN